MKVVKNKILKSIRGKGGNKGEVDNLNMSLMAPISGEYLQSKEFVKSLDLVCEGPIEGIVDSDGNTVKGQNILKGIYLDDTPVMTSDGSFNFNNVSVDYRYGRESQGSMLRHQSAVAQKEINFTLLGPFIGNQSNGDTDIRVTNDNGSTTDFAGWNQAKSADTDRTDYTHIVNNTNIKSVQLVLNIAKLNDTEEKGDQNIDIISEADLFGGDTNVDVQFRIGQPIDKTLRVQVEFGLLNTPTSSTRQHTFRGQTILGYLVELPDINFDPSDYVNLKNTAGFENLTIDQLKSRHPRYIRVHKIDFETDSTLTNSRVALAYIKENFKTDFRYPSSAMIGSVVDSSSFDQIPERSYDAKLLKVFVPEHYEPLNANGKDKRFNVETKPFSFNFSDAKQITKRVSETSNLVDPNGSPNQSTTKSSFGKCVCMADDMLVVSDPDWGRPSPGISRRDVGQIYFYEKNGYGKFTKLKGGSTSHQFISDLGVRDPESNFLAYNDSSNSVLEWIITNNIREITSISNTTEDEAITTIPVELANQVSDLYRFEAPFGDESSPNRISRSYGYFRGSPLDSSFGILSSFTALQRPLPYNLGNKEFLYVDAFKTAEIKGTITALVSFHGTRSAVLDSKFNFGRQIGAFIDSEFAKRVSGFVIGGVFDFDATKPDVVFAIRSTEQQYSHTDDPITITNRFARRMYIKIFAARVANFRSIGSRFILQSNSSNTPIYGIKGEETLKEADGSAMNVFPCLPTSITATITLVETNYQFITQIGAEILNATKNYVVADGRMNPEQGSFTSFPIALIAKKDDLGVWRKHNVIIGPITEDFTKELESAKISKDEKIAVTMFRDTPSDNLIRQNLIQVTNLQNNSTVSFHEYLGVFIDRIIGKVEIKSGSSQVYYESILACPNNHTIIVYKPAFEIEFLDQFSTKKEDSRNAVMVYRFKNQVWSLDQIVLSPHFAGFSPATDNTTSMDAVGKYITVGHARADGLSPYLDRGEGFVDLFKYNGKNYEYVTVFTPQSYTQLVSGGTTFSSPFPNESNTVPRFENFGCSVKIVLNDNGDPMIAVAATTFAEDPADINSSRTDGAIYVITKHPQKEEFLLDNIHTPLTHPDSFSIFESNNKIADSLTLSKDAMAFHRNNFVREDSMEIVKINIQGTPSRIYEKDLFWNGMLQKKWTDNPAWIIYDLLTNYTHGAGSMVDAAQDVNIFNFYDIGRYFDSVDDDGFYLPIYDEKGQTEARLSCNFLVKKDYNAFDLINAITDLFFGALYIENGKYNLWADKPTEPSWAFTNADVVNGDFTYSEKFKQDKVTVVKVPFLDKHESFKKKIEYVEDGNLLREYGKVEKELSFTAFTSRSQARRYGKQFLYNSSYETEIVNFQTDNNALFLSPGNVIEISDQLRNFSTKKEIYSMKEFSNFKEKLHIVSPSAISSSSRTIRYTEGTITDGDLSNAVYTHIDYNLRQLDSGAQFSYDRLAIKANSQGLPYIFLSESSGSVRFAVLKKNGNTFDQVDFLRDDFDYVPEELETNVVIDSSDNVIIPFITEQSGYAEVGYFKYSGGDFTNTSNWTSVTITDALNSGFKHDNQQIKGQIDSSGFLYLLTRIRSQSSQSGPGKYILYKIDTSNNTNQKYEFGEFNSNLDDYHFDMKLRNNLPAIVYKKRGRSNEELEIRYTEFTGGDFTSSASYSDVFVWGSQRDVFDRVELSLSANQDVYIAHNSDDVGSRGAFAHKKIYYARSEKRFDNKEWASNQILWDTSAAGFKSPIVFLQNKSLVTFLGGVPKFDDTERFRIFKGLQTFQLKDVNDIIKPQKFIKNTVYETDIRADFDSSDAELVTPDVDYSFSIPSLVLNNYDKHLYDNEFSIDITKTGNLLVSALETETVQEAYNKLQFDDIRFEPEQIITDRKHFLTITGSQLNGDFINLFPKEEKNTADVFASFNAKNSIAQVVDDTVKNKQYRVEKISEIDKNLYEITAKEFHSGKFNFIETYEKPEEAEESLLNIGVPKNNINTPPLPAGVHFITGTDAIGVKFVTGNITGVVNGAETKYRVGVTYPNGKYVAREFEKDSDNLSPSNEPITKFGFYNLPTVGAYDLKFKSLRNPESSSFIEKTFSIENDDPIVSANPFLKEVDIKSDEERIKINVDVRDVFGKRMILSSHNYYLTIKIQDEEILVNQKIEQFEFSLDELKEFTKKLVREMQFKVELHYNNQVIDLFQKTLVDMPPEILNAKVVGEKDLFINAEIKEFEKVRSIMVYANDKIVKTFFPSRKELIYSIPLYDFDIHELPEDEVIKFKIIAQDAFGDSEALDFDGVVPGSTSSIQRYQDSIAPIYSAQYWDQFSGELSNFESSNNQTGFYGNGSKAICELSSSMVSGESGNIKLQINSNNDSNEINLNFKNKTYLSQKTIVDMSEDFYGVNVLTEGGVFEGFEFKVKKI